jgi:hypothetical protein
LIGCDPELISISEWKQWQETFEQSEQQLIAVRTNLIDLLWQDERPQLPNNPIWKYPLEFAGERSSSFLVDLRFPFGSIRLFEQRQSEVGAHQNERVRRQSSGGAPHRRHRL